MDGLFLLCTRPSVTLPATFMNRGLDGDTANYLTMASKLCQTMPSTFNSEVQRRIAFEDIFQSLDKGLMQLLEYPLSAQEVGH